MEILFQLLLKGCTIEAISENRFGKSTELSNDKFRYPTLGGHFMLSRNSTELFQLLLKGCTIEAQNAVRQAVCPYVSVVVERMYD